MKDLLYQRKAVARLVDDTITLLNGNKNRRKLVFKAPTGSGKTFMACEALAQLVDALHDRGESKYQEVAFIWLAPRKLHLQSYKKLLNAYKDNRRLSPVMFDELDQSEGIQPGEILFVNWESVNKDKNIMARDSESKASIFEIARRTQEELRLPIVAIIDEEHMYWTKTADKSEDVLKRINPKVEIRISATPKTKSEYNVIVERNDVIDAEIIKKEVVLNPNINDGIISSRECDQHLLHKALEKRRHLAEAYKSMGLNINPLLLIQLPNDEKDNMTAEDNKVADMVKNYLAAMPSITVENGKLAIWLAEEKENLDGIEKPDNMVQVLLFKEAIALGWDCPRAAVLLIYRKSNSAEFSTQTVGRILRMPELRHYPDESLNVGYVYTDIARDMIEIVTQDASYLHKDALIAYRRENLQNVSLNSTYSKRPNAGRNYLGPDFKQVLYEEAQKFFNIERKVGSLFTFAQLAALRDDDDYHQLPDTDDEEVNENRRRAQTKIRLDVKNINAEIPFDVHFQNDVQTINVKNKVKYARTVSEINRVFLAYISGKGGKFESKGRTDKIASYLLEMMADYFGLFETDAKKVVLFRENQPKFDRLINLALDAYLTKRAQKNAGKPAREFIDYQWEVPEERVYECETHHTAQGDAHALLPFYELNEAYQPEKRFAAYLESHRTNIDWWYKNGDNGMQHYAIRYKNSAGQTALFYVDFVIRMKDGKIFLFDTKGTGGDIDTEVENKHNALIDYITAENAKGKNLQGGIIKQDQYGNWLYCKFKIEDANDTSNWDIFEL